MKRTITVTLTDAQIGAVRGSLRSYVEDHALMNMGYPDYRVELMLDV